MSTLSTLCCMFLDKLLYESSQVCRSMRVHHLLLLLLLLLRFLWFNNRPPC
jgi:hypothetical protein